MDIVSILPRLATGIRVDKDISKTDFVSILPRLATGITVMGTTLTTVQVSIVIANLK